MKPIFGLTVAAGLLFTTCVMAAPPPNTNPNSPTAQWYRSLQQPPNGSWNGGISCCSEADCRNVSYRIVNDHYEAFISRKTFGPKAPDKWIIVPNKNVIHTTNPTGAGVACWYASQVLCFVAAAQG